MKEDDAIRIVGWLILATVVLLAVTIWIVIIAFLIEIFA